MHWYMRYVRHCAKVSSNPFCCCTATAVVSLAANAKPASCNAQFEQKRRARAEWFEEAWKSSTVRASELAATEIYVVDFGSGFTRASLVTLGQEGSASSERVQGLAGPPLQKALKDPKVGEELIEAVATAIPCGEILGGATAGVRFGLETGTVTQMEVDAFAKAWRARLGERATFDILTGEQEALAEWRSAEYVIRSTEHLPGAPKLEDVQGMLSSGGISCQLAWRSCVASETDQMHVVSFLNMILDPSGPLALFNPGSDGPSAYRFKAALPAFESHIRKTVAATGVHSLQGLFVVIELFFPVIAIRGPPLGLGLGPYQDLPVSDVRAAIDEYIRVVLASDDPPQRGLAVSVLALIVADIVLQEMFDSSARLYCMGGVNWSIGWASERQSQRLIKSPY